MAQRPPEPLERREPLLSDLELGARQALLNAHMTLIDRIERALAKEGLPPLAWYDVLWACYRHPKHRLRMSGIADNTVLSRSGLTRLVDRMSAFGVLRREPSPGDRRGAFAVVTPSGERMLRLMWSVYGPCVQEHFAKQLSPEELAVVRDALGRLSRV